MYLFRHLATVLFISSFSINVTHCAHGFALEDSHLAASNEATEAFHVVIRNQRKDNKRRVGIDVRSRGRHITAAVNPRSPVVGSGPPPGGRSGSSRGRSGSNRVGTDRNDGYHYRNGGYTDPNGVYHKPPRKDKDGGSSVDPSQDDEHESTHGSDPPGSSEGSGVPDRPDPPDPRSTTTSKATPTSSHPGTSEAASPPPAASPSSDPPATSPVLSTTPTLALATSTVSSSPAAVTTSSAGNPLIPGAFENGGKWGFAMAGFLFYFSVNFVGL